jgi:hypothetical protein
MVVRFSCNTSHSIKDCNYCERLEAMRHDHNQSHTCCIEIGCKGEGVKDLQGMHRVVVEVGGDLSGRDYREVNEENHADDV